MKVVVEAITSNCFANNLFIAVHFCDMVGKTDPKYIQVNAKKYIVI